MKKILYCIIILSFCFCSCKSVQKQNPAVPGTVAKVPCYTDPKGKYIQIKDMNSGKSWKLTYEQWAELSKIIKE
jgi:hypothetical protein